MMAVVAVSIKMLPFMKRYPSRHAGGSMAVVAVYSGKLEEGVN